MRRFFKEKSYVFLFVLSCFSFNAIQSSAKEEDNKENKITPQNPRYEFTLNLNEFSIFNSSVMGGLKKYGGGAEFGIRMANEEEEIVWTVTINNPKLIEVLGYWTAEKSADLVSGLDVDNLDAKGKLALKTMKSLKKKVDYAQQNPIWDPVRVSGFVIEENGVLFIEGQQGKYQATGDYLDELEKRKGKRVIANGFVKVEDQIEVVNFLEKKENTLELFVMSLCPFAKIAEVSIIDFLETYSGKSKPLFEIHYIFYKINEGEKLSFTSMHGEKEIEENLVQMVIRDKHPEFYNDYLLERIAKSNTLWDELAKDIGMSDKEIESIKQTIKKDRDTLIQKEYDYVAATYQIYDASPSYVWECERIADIREVEFFKDLKFSSDKCSDEIE